MTTKVGVDVVLSSSELAAIAELMVTQGTQVDGALVASQITGGRSNLTVRLTDGDGQWVLRTPPRSGRTPSAHDVAREFRVMDALRGTAVPVPPAIAVCEDETLIGGPFAITEFVSGQTIQSRDDLEVLGQKTISEIASELVEVLVSLHQVDYREVGLTEFGRADGYAARQLRRWSGQWELVGTDEHAALATELIARLRESVPEQRATSVVHGDFRIDNTILNLEPAPRVAAVVDWELSTLGDPVADVAMMCAYRDPAFDLIVGAPGAWTSSMLPPAEALATHYERLSGTELDGWQSHLGLANFKIAVIAAGIDHRKRAGSGAGVGFDTAGLSVGPFLERGIEALDRGR